MKMLRVGTAVGLMVGTLTLLAERPSIVQASLTTGWSNITGQLTASGNNSAYPRGIAIGGGKIVVVGTEVDGQNSVIQNQNNIWVSNVDPVSFTALRVGTASSAWFHSVAYGNGIFLAIGSATNMQSPVVYTSPNGTTWTDRTSNVVFPVDQANNNTREFWWNGDFAGDVIFDGTEFIILGSAGNGFTWPSNMAGIIRTSNGITWSAAQYPRPANGVFAGVPSRSPSTSGTGTTFAKNGSTIVIAADFNRQPGQGSILVSTDGGTSWNFGYDNDPWDEGQILNNVFSVDGVVADGNPRLAPEYHVVGFGDGKFVGMQLDTANDLKTRSVAVSTDGLNWTTHTNALGPNRVRPLKLFHTGSQFVLITDAGIFTSSNAQTWTQTTFATMTVPSGDVFPDGLDFAFSNGLGLMSVAVVDNGNPLGKYLFSNGVFSLAPTVSAVSPSSGPAAGGTAITLTGTNYASGATVTVGGAACTNVTVVSATSLTCTTPAGSAGTASVVVTSGGLSGPANTLFTYNALPTTTTIASRIPSASASGPTMVTSANQTALTAAPGRASALVNGVAVTPQIVTASNSAAAQADPTERTPAQVRELQQAASAIETRLDTIAGGDSGVSVVRTETGAVMTGIFSGTRVPVEDVVVVNAADTATLFAARDVRGNIVEVKPGAVLEVSSNGDVAVQAFGLRPGENVELVVMSTPTLLGNYTVDAKGTIKTTAKLPTTIGTGNHSLVVASPSVKASLGLKLVKSNATLPATGATSHDLTNWAVAVLLSGVYVMMATRSRRRSYHL